MFLDFYHWRSWCFLAVLFCPQSWDICSQPRFYLSWENSTNWPANMESLPSNKIWFSAFWRQEKIAPCLRVHRGLTGGMSTKTWESMGFYVCIYIYISIDHVWYISDYFRSLCMFCGVVGSKAMNCNCTGSFLRQFFSYTQLNVFEKVIQKQPLILLPSNLSKVASWFSDIFVTFSRI